MCDGPDLFLCVLSILFPPIGVWVKRGICSADSLINFALFLLGYLPGLLHSWYIISSYPDPGYEPVGSEEGHVAVFYIHGAGRQSGNHQHQQQQQQQQPQLQLQGQPTYGTIAEHRLPEGQEPPPLEGERGRSKTPQPTTHTLTTQPQLPADGNGEGSSEGQPPPPSYAEVVKGDFKVQTDD